MFSSVVKIKDVKSDTGILIRALRKHAGISQQELAEQLKMSRITIQNLESGKNFTIDTLLKVLQYFDLLPSIHQMLKAKTTEQEQTKSLY